MFFGDGCKESTQTQIVDLKGSARVGRDVSREAISRKRSIIWNAPRLSQVHLGATQDAPGLGEAHFEVIWSAQKRSVYTGLLLATA